MRVGFGRDAVPFGVAAAALLLLVHIGHVDSADGSVQFSTTQSIVEHGRLSIPQQLNAVAGRHGLFYSKYGIGLSALGVIPYVLAWPFAHLTSNPEDVEQFAVTALIPLAAGALAGFLFVLALRLGADRRSALLGAVGAIVGTLLLAYSREFYTETLTALCVVIAVERTLARRFTSAALALAFACTMRPQMFVFAALFVLVLAWRERRSLVATLPPLVLAFAIDVAYNAARFGKPLQFGYPGERFTWHIGHGFHVLFLDPRKSILLFAPIVIATPFALAPLRRRSPLALVLLAGNALITLAITLAWYDPSGGFSWGPRLLLPAVVPLLAAVAVWISQPPALRRQVVVVLLAIGLIVNVSTIPVTPNAQLQLVHTPQASPNPVRQWRLVPAGIRYDFGHLGQKRQPLPGGTGKRLPMTWQFGLVNELGAKGAALAILISALLAGIAIWAITQLRRPRSAA